MLRQTAPPPTTTTTPTTTYIVLGPDGFAAGKNELRNPVFSLWELSALCYNTCTQRHSYAQGTFYFLFNKKNQIVKRKVGWFSFRPHLSLHRPGLYLGVCRPCNCYGMASTCDPESGVCRGCREDSEGVNCERCREGFEGDPTRGVECRWAMYASTQ